MAARLDGVGRILDTESGDLVRCKNCSDVLPELDDFQFSPRSRTHTSWGRVSPYKGFFAIESEGILTPVLIHFDESTASIERIDIPIEYLNSKAHQLRFSPMGDKFAWFSCTPLCTLVSYDIPQRNYSIVETPCTMANDMRLNWEDEVATPVHGWGAIIHKKACVDDQGVPLYRLMGQNEKTDGRK